MKFNFNLKGKDEGVRDVFADDRNQTQGPVQDLQDELYAALLELFPQDAVFHQPQEKLDYLRKLIRVNDPVFVARMAVYFRETLDLRSAAFMLTAELCSLHAGAPWARPLLDRVIQDPALLPEWFRHYLFATGVHPDGENRKHRISSRLRRQISPLFNKLDEYHVGRYSPEEQEQLRKTMEWVRPAADGKTQKLLFDKILHRAIPAKATWWSEWQSIQAQSYDSLELKQTTIRDKWKTGISSFRIGYDGLLDNLQPILSAGVSGKALKLAAEYIGHPAAVTIARPSPLSLLSAFRKIKGRREGGVQMLLDALDQAARQVSGLLGIHKDSNLVIAMDVSNSMKQPLQEGGCIQRYDVGPLMAYLLKDHCRTLTAGIIGNTWKPSKLQGGLLAGIDPFHRREGEAGYAINAHLVILDLMKRGQIADKLIIFTDSQLWHNRALHQPEVPDLVRAWQLYRKMAPAAELYLFDLSGYGARSIENPAQGVYQISGWQDRIFHLLQALDNRDEAIEQVKNIIL